MGWLHCASYLRNLTCSTSFNLAPPPVASLVCSFCPPGSRLVFWFVCLVCFACCHSGKHLFTLPIYPYSHPPQSRPAQSAPSVAMDIGFIVRHPLFLITFILAIPAWIIAFAAQCAAEAKYGESIPLTRVPSR